MAGSSKKEVKYRMRSIDVPKWYIAERMGSYGRMGTVKEAMLESKEFWKANAQPGWENYFTLEAEDG